MNHIAPLAARRTAPRARSPTTADPPPTRAPCPPTGAPLLPGPHLPR